MRVAENSKPHELNVKNRSLLGTTGVEKVESFDEREIVLQTTLGLLSIKGQNLHIRHLDLEEGRVMLDGDIASLVYNAQRSSGKGFLKRMAR